MELMLALIVGSLVFTLLYQPVQVDYIKTLYNIKASSGFTGKQVIEELLSYSQIEDVRILVHKPTKEFFIPYYEYVKKEIVLSEEAAHQTSVYSIAISLHEAFHAIQEKENHLSRVLRRKGRYHSLAFVYFILPLLFLANLLFPAYESLWVFSSMFIFILSCLFHLITIVSLEIHANIHTYRYMERNRLVTPSELKHVRNLFLITTLGYVFATPVSIFSP